MRNRGNPVFVTKPSLPPLDDFIEYLKEIWRNRILTNNGPFHQRFEKELADYLGVKYISLFTNGTLALLTAIKALKITGEVVTTPFTFVATTHSLWWNKIKPVFADIEAASFNLDPESVIKAITPKTKAILPVHVFGNPCNVEQFKHIAIKYNLKIIYDAAHAFGARIKGSSILDFGDMSVLSFHATKLFNTCEGGAVICHDVETKKQLDLMKNFGFEDQMTIKGIGINGKMNELQAALGLLQLRKIDEINNKCAIIAREYRINLKGIPGIYVQPEEKGIEKIYSFFPILIDPKEFGSSREMVFDKMKKNNIFCRRYFYPLISNIKPYCKMPTANRENLKTANRISEQVLSLPIYPDLPLEKVREISDLIRN